MFPSPRPHSALPIAVKLSALIPRQVVAHSRQTTIFPGAAWLADGYGRESDKPYIDLLN
ncbi:MAG: hypothetical protein HC880_07030 [Bacteroidia bacterium]|nr:hypothetical protein [Bacteroidia bacterium]